eukprot:10493169-Ditylum_brightwellii.AAC.1
MLISIAPFSQVQLKHLNLIIIENRKGGGHLQYEDPVLRVKRCLDPKFVSEHNVMPDLSSEKYVEVVLPFKKNEHCGKKYASFHLFTHWTNFKGTLAGAGKRGTCYLDFVPFTVKDLHQHIGLYIFHGLSSFGRNAEWRHKHFKAFLSIQNPAIETLPCN